MDKLDYVIAALIVIALGTLVYSATHPVRESFTELYFEDHVNLPRFTSREISFSYTIHNLEYEDFRYSPQIRIEFPDENISDITINEGPVLLKHDEYKTIRKNIAFAEPFARAKIRIVLPLKQQDIHFWITYSQYPTYYDGFGLMSSDCVNITTQINPSDSMIIRARADYAEGWPLLTLYIDGKNLTKFNVYSGEWEEYEYHFEFSGTHIIDLTYGNDFYNASSQQDRNVFLESITFGNVTVPWQDLIIDRGHGQQAFDCENTIVAQGLYSPGAYRLRVNISP